MNAAFHPLSICHTESSLGWGGQEHRILLEATMLARRGHRLLVAADPRGALYHRARKAGLTVAPLSFGGGRNIAAFLKLRQVLTDQQVDLLHTHSSLDSWVGFLAWLSLGRRPVWVRTRHLATRVSGYWPTRLLYRSPAAIITTSRGIAEMLHHRLGVRRERLHAIPTGISLTEFSPRPADPGLRAGLHLPQNAFLFGTVSVLRSWKGHLYVLEALGEVVARGLEAALVIVGEGPYRPVIEEKIRTLGLSGRVRLVGHQEHVAPWLALMDAFVMASYDHEGVPQALLQALAMARPVVASRIGGIPEVIKDNVHGLLAPPRDSRTLARLMLRLARDPSLRIRLGKEGSLLVRTHFSVDHMLRTLENLYWQLCPLRNHRGVNRRAPSGEFHG